MKIASLLKLTVPMLLALVLIPIATPQANLAGNWQGTLDEGGTTFHVAWHAVAAADGTLTSTIDNVDQNIFGVKVKTTTLKGSDLTMSVDDTINVNGDDVAIRGDLVAKLSDDGNEVTGTSTQTEPAQSPAPITLKRVAAQPASAPATSAQAAVVGDWSGTLDAGPAKLRLLLHIKAAADGTLTGTLDSIDQGANGIPLSSVAFKDNKLELNVAAVNGTYEGTVDKEASEITGTWTQGQPLPLNFTRAKAETASAPKPAAPTDIDGTWTGKLNTPGGTLTINLKIANMDTGLTAQIQSPDQSPNWAPATSIAREGDTLKVTFNAFAATFEGKIAADHSTIDGHFTQMGNELPLVLKKV
jgi:hypothetical protein